MTRQYWANLRLIRKLKIDAGWEGEPTIQRPEIKVDGEWITSRFSLDSRETAEDYAQESAELHHSSPHPRGSHQLEKGVAPTAESSRPPAALLRAARRHPTIFTLTRQSPSALWCASISS